MVKKHRITIIVVFVVIIVILTSFIWAKSNIKNVNVDENKVESSTTENNMAEKNLKWVYDTNQYQSYKQFTRFIHEFPPEALEYIGIITIDDTEYYQYGNEDIKIEVISKDSYNEKKLKGPVDYTVSYRGRTFTFQEDIPQYPENIMIYYVDINKDSTKDIVIKGALYSGSNIAYYWMRAVNLIYMEELEVFKTDDLIRLTIEQSDTLNKMLEEDIKFQSIFPDYEWMGNYANIMVDCFGNIYYEIGLGKELSNDIGKILLLFDYNKMKHNYDLVDYEYIRNYVFVDR